ncbi:MAG: hypothetical protein Q4C89_11020 [Deinococcus sp.]|uniref:hypothetical protein n=1 Tax=Deinococcus sp. TaxID=47478 RepID=UPI0026DD3B3B|nr:hypothetical protein [Deinococcus sp.]MDO4246545.1 hypothetical protein [Deinococcus sp.]
MTKKRHLSGAGGNQILKAKAVTPSGEEIVIPTARTSAVVWYVANPDGSWPKKDTLQLDEDVADVREGEYFWIEEMRPGEGMGNMVQYRVVEVRNVLRKFPGRWGQFLRQVLLVPVADADTVGDLSISDLKRNN